MALSNDYIKNFISSYAMKLLSVSIKVHSLVYVWMKVMILQKLHKLLCVRYFDVDENLLRERLLCLAYLTERPNAESIYTAVKRGLDFLNVSTKNMCAITADGAATMKSARNGVLSLFDKESDSDIFRLRCFVHQEVLVSKVIKNTMDDIESMVKEAINSINTSSILKNNIGSLCDTANEKHDVLVNYNHIRWLSFDTSVQHICELYDQVITTLVPKFNDLTKLHSWLYSISEIHFT
jgi:hypothetical protein